ncbi:MAG: LysR substrate-binding domain-containing protein [Pseudomonadota bacterium]|nr:LysR substrate-binding domain-containing protein [Pseudomonadota bacterium]
METYDLADLRAFCLVADVGSITGAARTLGETKGSVSRRITRLERALGVMLLRRSPRRVEATEDGAVYRARAGKALELLDDADTALRDTGAAPSGHLRVTAPIDLGATLLAPIVAAFVAAHPAVSVEMVLTEQVLDFDGHQIDVAFRAAASLPDSSLVAHKLLDLSVGLYAAPAYLEAAAAPEAPDALAEHRLLLHRSAHVQGVLHLQPPHGSVLSVRVRGSIVASDFSFLRNAALAGGGIAPLPTFLVLDDVAAGRLVRVLPSHGAVGTPLFLLTQGTRFPSPKVRAFRAFVTEWLKRTCVERG